VCSLSKLAPLLYLQILFYYVNVAHLTQNIQLHESDPKHTVRRYKQLNHFGHYINTSCLQKDYIHVLYDVRIVGSNNL
jgi:hypothetical protein